MKICNNCHLEKEKYYKGNNVCVECFRERRYVQRRNNPKLRMLSSARCRAREEGVPFNLEPKDFEIPELCPVLGIKLVFNFGVGGKKDNSPSLDKLFPKLGYIKGNVAVISFRANRMKGDTSLEEIEKLCLWMRQQLGQDNCPAPLMFI